jgi:hypothetical protein
MEVAWISMMRQVHQMSRRFNVHHFATSVVVVLAALLSPSGAAAGIMPGAPLDGKDHRVEIWEDGNYRIDGEEQQKVGLTNIRGEIALRFTLPFPVQVGTLNIFDTDPDAHGKFSGTPGDLLFFRGTVGNIDLSFYSDMEPTDPKPNPDLADVGIPDLTFNSEDRQERKNGIAKYDAVYPKDPNDPKSEDHDVWYIVHSDGDGLPKGPEIDPGSMASAVTLLSTGMLMLTARRRRK